MGFIVGSKCLEGVSEERGIILKWWEWVVDIFWEGFWFVFLLLWIICDKFLSKCLKFMGNFRKYKEEIEVNF